MIEASTNVMRQRILISLALAILGFYALLSVRRARAAAERLQLARQEQMEMQRLLDEIQQLSLAPRIAADDAEAPGAIGERIEAARVLARLPENAISDQNPLTPTRIERTDFEQRKVVVTLNPAPLASIATFCDALRDEDTGSVVSDLKLTIPSNSKSQANQEAWRATLILTQTIYSPKSQ